MPCWVLACKLGSPTDDPFPRYKLWISTHSSLSTGVEIDANEEEDAIGDCWLESWNASPDKQSKGPGEVNEPSLVLLLGRTTILVQRVTELARNSYLSSQPAHFQTSLLRRALACHSSNIAHFYRAWIADLLLKLAGLAGKISGSNGIRFGYSMPVGGEIPLFRA